MSDITLEEYEAFEKNDKDPPEHLLKKWEGNFMLSSRWLIAGKGNMYLDPEDVPEKESKSERDQDDRKRRRRRNLLAAAVP